MSKTRVELISEHIQNCVRALNTHDDPRHNRMYNEGFVLGHLASIFERDPIMYRQFLEHCESIGKTRGQKVDMHRK